MTFTASLVSMLVLATMVPLGPLLPDLSTHKEVKVEMEIQASSEDVWNVLTNFAAYNNWNPYIYPASGTAVAGKKLDITLHGSTLVHFSPTVLVATPSRELTWTGRLPSGAIERTLTFDIVPIAAHRVRLTAIERFRGLLLPLAVGVANESKAGLTQMSKALRDRAELLDFSLPAPHK